MAYGRWYVYLSVEIEFLASFRASMIIQKYAFFQQTLNVCLTVCEALLLALEIHQ